LPKNKFRRGRNEELFSDTQNLTEELKKEEMKNEKSDFEKKKE